MKNTIKETIASIVFAIMLTLLILSFVAASPAPKEYNCYETMYVTMGRILHKIEATTVSVESGLISINGKDIDCTVSILSHYTRRGYDFYKVTNGTIQIHHRKVFVEVGSIDNVYLY